jgi:hypothetical protein
LAISVSLLLSTNKFLYFWTFTYALAAYCYFVYSVLDNNLEKGFSNLILLDFFKAIIILPFCSLGKLFIAMFTGKARTSGKTIGKIFLGLTVTIIPTIIVTLLLSYDSNFISLLDKILDFDIVAVFSHIFSFGFAIPIGMFLFGLYNSASENKCKETIHALSCKKAYQAYDGYMADIVAQGQEMIQQARQQGKRIIVLAGRPYHADPEINHGIHKLIAALGFAVISEDAVAPLEPAFKVNILSQWTYHHRLFSAARYVAGQEDMYLVHLVSFGCGLDALTADEVRSILEVCGKLYTQIKIDEVTNLGAVKIRLRSLIAAIEQENKGKENEDNFALQGAR